jgi:hypothetical protein
MPVVAVGRRLVLREREADGAWPPGGRKEASRAARLE